MASKWLVTFIREVPRLECFGDGYPTYVVSACASLRKQNENCTAGCMVRHLFLAVVMLPLQPGACFAGV